MVRIKLLHVTSSLKIGGAEAILCDLIHELGNREFEHHVIYFHGGPREKPLRSLGISLYQIRGLVRLYDPVFFWRLFRVIKQLRPDCIHSLLWSANVASRVAAWLFSIPHVSVYHNNIDQDGRLRNLLDALTRQLSTKLVAVSDEVARSILPAYQSRVDKKMLVIHNGIDAGGIRKKGAEQGILRTDLGLNPEHFVVGSVGRFCPIKNYPLLLESFSIVCSEHPNARLLLVGSGPDERMLHRRVQNLGITEKTLFVKGQPAYGYFPLLDCFVQSSNKEGISMALLEAMSHAVVCVVTNMKPVHSVLNNQKDGLVVPADDTKALAGAMSRLIRNRNQALSLGRAGQKTVERSFRLERMVKAYRNLFISM